MFLEFFNKLDMKYANGRSLFQRLSIANLIIFSFLFLIITSLNTYIELNQTNISEEQIGTFSRVNKHIFISKLIQSHNRICDWYENYFHGNYL